MTISTDKCKMFNFFACETLEKHGVVISLTIIIEIVLPIGIFANGDLMSKVAIPAPSISKGRSSNSLTKEKLVILLELREIGCRSVSQLREELVLADHNVYMVENKLMIEFFQDHIFLSSRRKLQIWFSQLVVAFVRSWSSCWNLIWSFMVDVWILCTWHHSNGDVGNWRTSLSILH